MRKADLVLIAFIVFMGMVTINGCAPFMSETVFDRPRVQEETRTFYVAITSEPSDAEIWFDNQLIGRTPVESFPLLIPTYYTPYKPLVSAEYTSPKGDHFIRISKPGYLDATKVLEYICKEGYGNGTYYDLKDNKFHFNLQKREKE